jgi:hypothetical protein
LKSPLAFVGEKILARRLCGERDFHAQILRNAQPTYS